ncbi:HET-domain-containing protein [Neurospora hispaniola]|uniref:HET-domain-containing protein n=1 Tax=Neurospora hispaniola TaxID=588809 RepID=A0AAJ0I124_9PEZI|nr:HET-domain-containing protein [Neurospora hispaniola]
MEGKQSRVRFADEDGGRLSTAYRQIVAKMPFLDVKEQEQQQQPEELQEEEEEQKQQEEVEVEEEEHEGSPNLCQRCKELDLDMIFNGLCLDLDSGSEMVLSLGILDKDSPCGLCQFFYSMRRPNLTGETTGFYHLRKYILENYHMPKIWSNRFSSYTVWAVDPGSGSQDLEWGGHGLSIQHMTDRPQLLFLPQSTQPCPYPEEWTFKGLPVSETSINYRLLRHWIMECEDHWGCRNSSSELINAYTGPTIRVIDCATRHIVDRQPGDRYIALSYVWGNQPLVGNKGSRVLPTNAPKVVEDAMVVVKRLGQQYLWVDQYCIDQHNDQDKHAQIKNMDRIYEGSHATIVAFSGVDSSSGLPGVSSIPRTRQHRFTSSKVTLLGFTPPITRQPLDASIWMKRGWTFQEALLSRRLLIFTQEQVYFLCSRGWWVESCTRRSWMRNTTNKFKPFLPLATVMTVKSASASTIHWAIKILLA